MNKHIKGAPPVKTSPPPKGYLQKAMTTYMKRLTRAKSYNTMARKTGRGK